MEGAVVSETAAELFFSWLQCKETLITESYVHKEEPNLKKFGEIKVSYTKLMGEVHVLLEDWHLNDGDKGFLFLNRMFLLHVKVRMKSHELPSVERQSEAK